MRVALVGDFAGTLSRRLEVEGDQVVKPHESPDLVIGQTDVSVGPSEKPIVVTGVIDIPTLGLKEIDFPIRMLEEGKTPTHGFHRWFNRKMLSYNEQLVLSIPIVGMMNDGLGAQVQVGAATKFISFPSVEGLFEHPGLIELLRVLKHNGLVSIYACGKDVVRLSVGLGGMVGYNFLEYIVGKLSDWFVDPKRLYEAWAISNLVSRFPYPQARAEYPTEEIKGLTESIERHFWLKDFRVIRKTPYATGGEIGVASAYSPKVWEASERVLRTCRNISVQQVQYRTDLCVYVQHAYENLAGSLVVP
jgi:hypothetical protein